MFLAFALVSCFLGMFFSYIWNGSSVSNVLVKMSFIAYTVWAIFIALVLIAPLVNNGTIHLF